MKIRNIIAAICSCLVLVSCSEDSINVTGVSLDPKVLNLGVGDTSMLTANIEPANAENIAVRWKSLDESIATVSQGVVRGIAPGTTSILVITDDSNLTDNCQVNVTAYVTRIDLDKTSLSLKEGEWYQLTATFSPANASNKTLKWTSSNSDVATVSEDGFVLALSVGEAIITATSEDGGLSSSCKITVTKKVSGLTLNKTFLDMVKGDEFDLVAQLEPEGTSVNITWMSTQPDIVSVDEYGHLTAKSTGDAFICAATYFGGQQAFCQVHVREKIQSITISPSSEYVNIGNTLQLEALIAPANLEDITIEWSSSDPSKASINANGLVTGKAQGNVEITVTVTNGTEQQTKTIDLKIYQPVTSISVSKSSLELFEDEQLVLDEVLKVTLTPETADIKTVHYGTSDYFKVENGKLIPLKPGKDDLIIYPDNPNSESLSAKCTITVKSRVKKISIEPSNLQITVDETYQLKATIEPSGAANQEVSWTSSDTNVAKVDEKGNVTALKAGNATITATSKENSSIKGTCKVTVENIKVDSIELDKTSLTLTEEETAQLTATIKPDKVIDKSVTWKSSNPNIATVSNTGLVKAIAAGTATITVSSNANNAKTATCSVTVQSKIESVNLNVTALSMIEGETSDLVATIKPDNAKDKTVTWTSSNPSVADVSSSGRVTAVSEGSATITATSNADKTKTATCKVDVLAKSANVTGVTLSSEELTLEIGESSVLTATVIPSNATNKAVTWKSSDPYVATVSSTGRVNAVSPGTAMISVTTVEGGFVANCVVTVPEAPVSVTSITLSTTSTTLEYGSTKDISVKILPDDATDKSWTWTSSNSAIASLTNTTDTGATIKAGNTAGTATITISSVANPSVTAKCVVTVKAQIIYVSSITISPSRLTMYVGQTKTVTATVLPENADNPNIEWDVPQGGVVTVDQNGKVTAKKEGSSRVIASSLDGAKSSWIPVTVTWNAVASISLSNKELVLKEGETYDITVTLTGEDPSADPSNLNVKWNSSSTATATVSKLETNSARITALKAGTSTITVTSSDDTTKTATCTVKVISSSPGSGGSEGVGFDDWTFGN